MLVYVYLKTHTAQISYSVEVYATILYISWIFSFGRLTLPTVSRCGCWAQGPRGLPDAPYPDPGSSGKSGFSGLEGLFPDFPDFFSKNHANRTGGPQRFGRNRKFRPELKPNKVEKSLSQPFHLGGPTRGGRTQPKPAEKKRKISKRPRAGEFARPGAFGNFSAFFNFNSISQILRTTSWTPKPPL